MLQFLLIYVLNTRKRIIAHIRYSICNIDIRQGLICQKKGEIHDRFALFITNHIQYESFQCTFVRILCTFISF